MKPFCSAPTYRHVGTNIARWITIEIAAMEHLALALIARVYVEPGLVEFRTVDRQIGWMSISKWEVDAGDRVLQKVLNFQGR